MHFVKFSRDVSQNYISKGLNLFKADTKTNIINNRPSDKSGFYFQAETLFPRDCWQREAVQSPGEQHRGVARAVQEESQVHDAWRLVSAGTSSIVRSFLWFMICVMTSGEAGHEEHVPGVRHGETLHPRHVPLPGARHLHRHRPHFPQVCPIWHLSCPFSGVLI